METERINGDFLMVQYVGHGGRVRYAIVADAGDNGYSVPAHPSTGCRAFQSRDLRRVVRYAAAHGSTYADRSGALRAYRRDYT